MFLLDQAASTACRRTTPKFVFTDEFHGYTDRSPIPIQSVESIQVCISFSIIVVGATVDNILLNMAHPDTVKVRRLFVDLVLELKRVPRRQYRVPISMAIAGVGFAGGSARRHVTSRSRPSRAAYSAHSPPSPGMDPIVLSRSRCSGVALSLPGPRIAAAPSAARLELSERIPSDDHMGHMSVAFWFGLVVCHIAPPFPALSLPRPSVSTLSNLYAIARMHCVNYVYKPFLGCWFFPLHLRIFATVRTVFDIW